MNVQISAGQLRSALGAFRGLISRRNTIPVLGTVKLQSGMLVGTDLDCELAVKMVSVGPMEGDACIDWFALSALAKHIDDSETLTVSDVDSVATVAFNGSSYRLGSLPSTDFPSFIAPDGPRTMSGNLGLVAAMQRIRFAMSTEQTRYYICGVAIVAGADGKPLLVATSGHQLAMIPLDAAPEGSIGAIIPGHIVHYLSQCKTEPESCVFDRDRCRARFDFAGISLSTKLIDHDFPDINRVVPQNPVDLFSADKTALLRVLRRMRAFGSGPLPGVKLSLRGDALTLAMNRGDIAATEKLAVTGKFSEPAEAGFNADYLISIIQGLRGETVNFASSEFSTAATVITSDGDPLAILQMPMRV